MEAIAVGDVVADFTLKTQFGEDVSLSNLAAERPVLVVFYPFAFSGICTSELCAIRDTLPQFSNERLQVVGISCDPMFTQRAWADDQGYEFPLLSDFWPHGEVASSFGVFDEARGFAIRGTFLVDADLTVRWALVNGAGEARDFSGAVEAAASL